MVSSEIAPQNAVPTGCVQDRQCQAVGDFFHCARCPGIQESVTQLVHENGEWSLPRPIGAIRETRAVGFELQTFRGSFFQSFKRQELNSSIDRWEVALTEPTVKSNPSMLKFTEVIRATRQDWLFGHGNCGTRQQRDF